MGLLYCLKIGLCLPSLGNGILLPCQWVFSVFIPFLAAECSAQTVAVRTALQVNGLGLVRSSSACGEIPADPHPTHTQEILESAGADKVGMSVASGIAFSVLLINNREMKSRHS